MSGSKQVLNAEQDIVSIVAMSEHDLLEVVHIENLSRLSKWGFEAYYDELQAPERAIMLVARQIPQRVALPLLAGFIASRLSGDELHINNIAVRPGQRGQGIGGTLLDAVLTEGIQRGAVSAVLEVRETNAPAQALYASRGFETAGKRKAYYTDPVEDAVVMTRLMPVKRLIKA